MRSTAFVHLCTADYSHRKEWVIDRLRELSGIFAIDICAYAVLSNHYHTILFVDIKRAQQLSEHAVVSRWTKLFQLPEIVRRYRHGGVSMAEQAAAKQLIELWRARLMDVSGFMRCLNEHLARRANAEDHCSGRFWEGRFKSQALLDEAGLLTAMAYVDLNPIRSGIAATPETSEFISIYDRIRALQGKRTGDLSLRRFRTEAAAGITLPCALNDYLHLVDWTGRAIRADQLGSIDDRLPPILTRLNIDAAAWTTAMQPDGNVFGRAIITSTCTLAPWGSNGFGE